MTATQPAPRYFVCEDGPINATHVNSTTHAAAFCGIVLIGSPSSSRPAHCHLGGNPTQSGRSSQSPHQRNLITRVEWNDGNSMPRVLNLRALCAHCERAEANAWSVPHRTPLCKSCAVGQPTKPVPIVSASVVTALCSHCGIAPASLLAVDKAAPLCEICAAGKGEVVPLRESDACGGIVFDKMDFSGLQGKGVDIADVVQGERVDLSYYKTKVPQSLVGERKRSPDLGKSSSPRRRRR